MIFKQIVNKSYWPIYFQMGWLRASSTYFYFICFIETNAFDFAYFTRLDFGNWHFALKNMQAINHVYKWPIASPVLFSFFGQAFYEIRICCILAIMILSFKCDETSNIEIFFHYIVLISIWYYDFWWKNILKAKNNGKKLIYIFRESKWSDLHLNKI